MVALAGDKMNQTRQRVQRELTGGRGRRDDPLYKARRLLHTGIGLLTERQNTHLDALFATDDHAEVEITWSVYQNIIAAYRNPDRTAGRTALSRLIDAIKTGVPKAGGTGPAGADPPQAPLRHPGVLRPSGHLERSNGSDQRPSRAPPRHRARVPEPGQLPTQVTPRSRRLQTPAPLISVKSPIQYRDCESQRPGGGPDAQLPYPRDHASQTNQLDRTCLISEAISSRCT